MGKKIMKKKANDNDNSNIGGEENNWLISSLQDSFLEANTNDLNMEIRKSKKTTKKKINKTTSRNEVGSSYSSQFQVNQSLERKKSKVIQDEMSIKKLNQNRRQKNSHDFYNEEDASTTVDTRIIESQE